MRNLKNTKTRAPEFGVFDVCDSMQAAAARLNVPLAVVKRCKAEGSPAFKGSRVYLQPLAEMIAAMDHPDSIRIRIPTSVEPNGEIAEEFRDMLRMAIRCRLLTTPEILAIILDQVILHFRGARPGREAAEMFDKLTRAIHEGFGVAVMLLDDPATDEFLKRSATAFKRARKKLFQSDPARRACK
jgi:hypothetical protein